MTLIDTVQTVGTLVTAIAIQALQIRESVDDVYFPLVGADISAAYLQRLNDSYTRFFHQYGDAPLLIVNAAELLDELIDGDEYPASP